MGLSVVSRDLPRDICGLYDDRHRLILLADWLNQRQRRRTLCHELIHARHHDPGLWYTIRGQMRAPLPQGDRVGVDIAGDHGMAETMHEGNAWMMAVELGVTVFVQ